MDKTQLFLETLHTPVNALPFSLLKSLKEAYPDKAILETEDSDFYLHDFVKHGHCAFEFALDFMNQCTWGYRQEWDAIETEAEQQWYRVDWQGQALEIASIKYKGGEYGTTTRYILFAETDAIAREFFHAVCRWNSQLRGEVLVFDGGCWQKSDALYQAIQAATFDNLVLPAALGEEIRADFSQFFQSREMYERYRIPWKRGALLVGPPGNGKTHAVKALVNWLGVPCLYVKSFKAQYHTDQDCIRSVFARARKTTPCLLVLEDLDSLITDRNRSFFLNELDGFAANTGIVVLATTNHPDRIDPAILDRPSRFDRKYHFNLPQAAERDAYIHAWEPQLEPEMRLSETGARMVVEATDGFSFAYLKELLLSSLMRWIHDPRPGKMDAVMLEQCEMLRSQMSSMEELSSLLPSPNEDEDEG